MVKHVSESGADAIAEAREHTPGDAAEVPGPSTNPATNLIMADIAMRAGSYVLRSAVEKGFLSGRYGKETASNIVQNKTLGQNIVSFALAKVATRSLPGAIVVGGGVVAKTLFDRSQKRRKSKRAGDKALIEQSKDS
ncbi:hypothetical protein [Pontixanthobacter luteolus]|uniref:hypothetical protein n=1 Tax=Pontixanthobacter luteolus TaxID=295089 RepID=UPI001928AD34|nr:hypothetical protein [Pontixanthobacter luteolus]